MPTFRSPIRLYPILFSEESDPRGPGHLWNKAYFTEEGQQTGMILRA